MTAIKRILIVPNPTKADAESVAEKLRSSARARGLVADISKSFPLAARELADRDLCIVIGGDGSLLGVVPAIAEHAIPVMGVNLGTLGFMANFTPERAVEELFELLHAPLVPTRRRLLEITTAQGHRVWALNDLVIKVATSRLARLLVHTAEGLVNTYYADGLIVATPTGSTAYNLSAGGPILHPGARALALTPINPHTLTNRAIVLDESVELEIELQPHDTPMQLAADGTPLAEEADPFPVKVKICPDRVFPLLQPPGMSAFDLLRTKLRWTGDTPARLQENGAPENS